MNVNNMTAQECADWCAEQDGWRFEYNASKYKWWKPAQLIMPSGKPSPFLGRTWADHPHPPTLDGAAAALPKCAVGVAVEWHPDWYNGECCAKAYKPSGWLQSFNLWLDVFGPDELTARFRLAVACRLAMREIADVAK